MSFQDYYAALIRNAQRSELRADEALRDYQALLKQIVVAGVM